MSKQAMHGAGLRVLESPAARLPCDALKSPSPLAQSATGARQRLQELIAKVVVADLDARGMPARITPKYDDCCWGLGGARRDVTDIIKRL